MNDQKYNGWTNYATWRVNLEIFDGWDADGYEVSPESLEETVNELLDCEGETDGLLRSYANAFLADVNWYEIAKHLNEDLDAA